MLEEFKYGNPNHRGFFLNILGDKEICKYLGRGQLIDLVMLPIIKKYILNIDGKFVGLGFIQPLNEGEVEIRYCILEKFRGKGYSTILVNYLLEQIDDDKIVYADIQSENFASAKAVLKNEFTTNDNFIYSKKR